MVRKVLAIIAMSLPLVLAFTVSAFATQGDSTYLPSGGVSPHGGYQTTTKKCGVCHAVHHAGEFGDGLGSEMLLRSTAADACTYCHISPGVSTLIVYNGNSANYSGADNPHGHNFFVGTSVQCTSCHQVHAAASDMENNPFLTAAILKKATTGYDADSDPAHAGTPQPGDNKDLAISKWCTKCHTYWPGVDTDSHTLELADGSHSFSASSYCSSCHNSNTVGGIVSASAFPHYTDGVRFLTSAGTANGGSANATPAVDSQNDGVCLRCHRDGAGNGVGQTF